MLFCIQLFNIWRKSGLCIEFIYRIETSVCYLPILNSSKTIQRYKLQINPRDGGNNYVQHSRITQKIH